MDCRLTTIPYPKTLLSQFFYHLEYNNMFNSIPKINGNHENLVGLYFLPIVQRNLQPSMTTTYQTVV